MADWHVSDIEDIFSVDELDQHFPPKKRARVKRARIEAFLLRRRKGGVVPNVRRKSLKLGARNRKRAVGDQARRIIVAAKRGSGGGKVEFDVEAERAALISRRKQSILLDGFVPNRRKVWRSMATRLKSRKIGSIDIEDFSFLTEPNKTLNSLVEIAVDEAHCLSSQIHFRDQRCEDIGAWLVLAAMRQDMASIFTGGNISDETSNVIAALEMDRAMRMRMPKPRQTVSSVWSFPIRARRPAGSSTSATQFLDRQETEEVATDLCHAISIWLTACVDQQLSIEGRRNVMTLVTEALDNAERHSRPEHANDGDWWMTGFMTKESSDSGERFKCQLALLSVGSPISSTIMNCADETKIQMNAYVKQNRRKLGGGMKYADEHLRTVYALQDFVSGDSEAHNNQRGGIGLGTILKVFADLAGHDKEDVFARLAIVSGRSCLHLSRDECDAAVTKSLRKPFNIWFNDEHSADLPPRDGAVVEMERDFPGTLVTMSFELDPGYLERTIHAPD
ncbi:MULTISPECIES: hypothetical protein [Phaeobacter]|uniref:hypothetical protein n=1 Tax=Phaeobacter TaxID=302485 RepID=UPI000C9CAB70|nr:hypothetical protein [Phaeobacter inhibens]AUR03879.1 hypothetical protein PhaeoP72_01906 [Phaeobacter inhibens]